MVSASLSPLKNGVRRARHALAAGLCAVLGLALAFMALAVLVQALAVMVVAVLAVFFLLPHPLRWYAAECGEAAGVFFDRLSASFSGGGKGKNADRAEESEKKDEFGPQNAPGNAFRQKSERSA